MWDFFETHYGIIGAIVGVMMFMWVLYWFVAKQQRHFVEAEVMDRICEAFLSFVAGLIAGFVWPLTVGLLLVSPILYGFHLGIQKLYNKWN